jgi:membrane protein
MTRLRRSLFAALRRVVPDCITQSQAIAFNMFLAFFPMMLLVLGVVATSGRLREGVLDIVQQLGVVFPPGAEPALQQFLTRPGQDSWAWISLGLSGTLIAGTQMMRLMIEGFRMVYRDKTRPSFGSRNVRALLLLSATIVPWFLAATLIVFGHELRDWVITESEMPLFIGALWSILYVSVELLLAMSVLMFIYRVGRPGTGSWRAVLPGAALATLLWWLASSAFGFYMRRVPAAIVYGNLAAAIALMIWMYLTAAVVLLGAAFNAQQTGPG